MKPSWFILAVLVLLASPATADDDTMRSATIAGAGRDACSAWISDRDATSEPAKAASQRRIEWIYGFFGAISVFAGPSGNLHGGLDDPDGMLGWIDNYCRTHPNDQLWVASSNLVFDLRNRPRS